MLLTSSPVNVSASRRSHTTSVKPLFGCLEKVNLDLQSVLVSFLQKNLEKAYLSPGHSKVYFRPGDGSHLNITGTGDDPVYEFIDAQGGGFSYHADTEYSDATFWKDASRKKTVMTEADKQATQKALEQFTVNLNASKGFYATYETNYNRWSWLQYRTPIEAVVDQLRNAGGTIKGNITEAFHRFFKFPKMREFSQQLLQYKLNLLSQEIPIGEWRSYVCDDPQDSVVITRLNSDEYEFSCPNTYRWKTFPSSFVVDAQGTILRYTEDDLNPPEHQPLYANAALYTFVQNPFKMAD